MRTSFTINKASTAADDSVLSRRAPLDCFDTFSRGGSDSRLSPHPEPAAGATARVPAHLCHRDSGGKDQVDQEGYYSILKRTQKDDGNLTDWILWFRGCLERAIEASYEAIDLILAKSLF